MENANVMETRGAPRPVDVLVTGGTGFIGRWLVARLTAQGRQVGVLARGGEARRAELAPFVNGHGGDARLLTFVDADLAADDLGLTDESSFDQVRDVFHLGAAFAFGMEEGRAANINVQGTLRLAALALRLPRLRRFVALGGYRATQPPAWLASATYPFDSSLRRRLYRTHGAYEASKLEAHRALDNFAETQGLPLTWVHPSTVIGSAKTGETSQRTGLADTVERLWNGRLPVGVGTAETFLPIVCVDYLAEFLASVPADPETLAQELCVLDPHTPNLPELLSAIAAHLGVRAPRRMLGKAWIAALPERLSGVEKETLSFLSEDRYDTRSAEAHAARHGLTMPEWQSALPRWLDYLVATRFLEGEEARGRFIACSGSRTYIEGDIHTADVLFLHGLPWDGESGRPLEAALSPELRWARVDLPGMGRSSACRASRADWLEELIAMRSKPIRIVAHSLSTGLALRVAQRAPERVSELVLISPFFLQAPAARWLRCPRIGRAVFRRLSLKQLEDQLAGTAESTPRALASAHRHLGRASDAIAHALSRASSPEARAELAQMLGDTPVRACLIHGANDPLVNGALPDATYALEGCGHNPHLEDARGVAEAITRWRGRCVTGRHPSL